MNHDAVIVPVTLSDASITLRLEGEWLVTRLDGVERQWRSFAKELPQKGTFFLDVGGVERIDTAGMLLFIRIRATLKRLGPTHTVGLTPAFCRMFRLLRRYDRRTSSPSRSRHDGGIIRQLADLGERTVRLGEDLLFFLHFLGETVVTLLRTLLHPASIRLKETASHIYKAGVTALPIVALSAFLVGVVVAYQSAVQLEKYGANIFIVDMIGISIPRELGPLITAIIVAGRSGSAYTAQIGVMKITEELDAMKTMGFEIFRFVVLPRIVAMVVALPLLIFFADMVGIYGGMLVAKAQLGINFTQFLDRLEHAVAIRHYLIGLFKAPFFAFIIAAIGCFRGFQVTGDTESIGRYTTMSVVNAIFLVVAADALFSVIFTELGL